MKVIGEVKVDVEHCKGCELCVHACSFDVLRMETDVNGKGYHYAYVDKADLCTGCTNCAVVCPDGVLTVYRKKIQ